MQSKDVLVWLLVSVWWWLVAGGWCLVPKCREDPHFSVVEKV
jgi:hypothetical protein